MLTIRSVSRSHRRRSRYDTAAATNAPASTTALTGKLPVTSNPFNWEEIGWDGGHLHYFTKKTYCGLLEDCGFRILKLFGSGLLGDFRRVYPSLLCADVFVLAEKV